jgi:hypothetical protein
MDRLARNLNDLRQLVRTLTGKGVKVVFAKESLTFTGEDPSRGPDSDARHRSQDRHPHPARSR